LAFLNSEVPDVPRQLLVIQAEDPANARAQFAHFPSLEVVPYSGSHEQASLWAQMLSRRPEAPDGFLPEEPSTPPRGWLQPRMFAASVDASVAELDQMVFGVDDPLGTSPERALDAEKLLEARRALLVASPGMGKSELLLHLARSSADVPTLLLLASDVAAELDPTIAPHASVARALVRRARSFAPNVPRPTLEALRSGPLAILIDGLDEVPGARASVAEAIVHAADAWPQHHWVVASRPISECHELVTSGFSTFRLWPSTTWAREYLDARGIKNAARTQMEQSRGFDDLIGIPLFAGPIADRLASNQLPERPLDLLIDAQRNAAQREQEREAIAGSLFNWVGRLAVGLELQGRSTASPAELRAITGGTDLGSEAFRERLIRGSLLAEIPDVAAFPRRTMQEALCAHAILSQQDVAAAVREIAEGAIGEEVALRNDIEFTLDLAFENADRDQRAALREIDETRWARTVASRGCAVDAGEALDVLLSDARDGVFGFFADGMVRSPRAAARGIGNRWPQVVLERQDPLFALSRSARDSDRANAMAVLGGLPDPAPEIRERTVDLVEDPDELTARFAVAALVQWGGPDLRGTLVCHATRIPDDGRVWSDLVAAIVDRSTTDAELAEVVTLAGRQPKVLGEVLADLVNRMQEPSTLLGLIERWPSSRDLLLWLLHAVTGPQSSWTDDDAEVLIRAIIATASVSDVAEGSTIASFLREHADAAVRVLAERARHRPSSDHGIYLGLWVLREDDRDRAAAASATLAEYLKGLAGHFEPWPPPTPRVTYEQRLRQALDAGDIDEDHPEAAQHWPREVAQGHHDRLAELAEAWWPEQPLTIIDRWRSPHTDVERAAAALSAAAATGLRISRERWLDAVCASEFLFDLAPGAYGWLARQYEPAWQTDVTSLASAAEDGRTLTRLIAALPNALGEPIVAAIVQRLGQLTAGDGWNTVVGLLAERGFVESLRPLLDGNIEPGQRDVILEHLASAGDTEAQLHTLRRHIESAEANAPLGGLVWEQPIGDPSVVQLLGQLIERLPYRPSPPGVSVRFGLDPRDAAEALLAQARSPEALAVYDRLAEREPERNFDLARRSKVRDLVTQQVKARLPDSLDAIADILWPAPH
jgi:hypothetical protein